MGTSIGRERVTEEDGSADPEAEEETEEIDYDEKYKLLCDFI